MPLHTVSYLFEQSPRSHTFDLTVPALSRDQAAMHLIQLHFGDSENSLNIPNADAPPDEILRQAELLGFAEIEVRPHAQH
jgi:hypothetical protein